MPFDRASRRHPIPVAGMVLALLLSGLVGLSGLSGLPGMSVGRAYGFTAASVSITGHGFGHGRGMGQYGALGYAVDQRWTYHQILDHYYGGTVPGHVGPTTPITVDMTSRDGLDTIVVQERGEFANSPPL